MRSSAVPLDALVPSVSPGEQFAPCGCAAAKVLTAGRAIVRRQERRLRCAARAHTAAHRAAELEAYLDALMAPQRAVAVPA